MSENNGAAITHGTRIFFLLPDGTRMFGIAGEIMDDGTALIDCTDETRILPLSSLTIAE